MLLANPNPTPTPTLTPNPNPNPNPTPDQVRQMLTRAEENARRILSENAADLHKLANGLLEHETLTLAEIQELLASKGGKNEALK